MSSILKKPAHKADSIITIWSPIPTRSIFLFVYSLGNINLFCLSILTNVERRENDIFIEGIFSVSNNFFHCFFV